MGDSPGCLRGPGGAPLAHRLGDGPRPGPLAGFHRHPDRGSCGPAGNPGEFAGPPLGRRGVLLSFLPLAVPGAQEIRPARGNFFARQGAWFYAVVSVSLAVFVWLAIPKDPMLAFGAVVGSTAYFITHGFKRHAAAQEDRLLRGDQNLSDAAKILYLEVIDATFSIDGVVGAFAFTLSVPLILIGNGIGAVVVRQLTIYNLDKIKKYVYLKNGAMYSVLVLGFVMLGHGFGIHIPEWVAPLATTHIVGYFFLLSWRQARRK